MYDSSQQQPQQWRSKLYKFTVEKEKHERELKTVNVFPVKVFSRSSKQTFEDL
jgi:hypothetical protein